MTQLVLDVGGYAIALPESQKQGYTVDEETLSQDLIMIPGNMVKEIRGDVWVITYQYGYFNDTDKDRVIEACKKGKKEPILCTFLTPDGNQTVTSTFFVTSFTRPRFMWSRNSNGETVPMWGDFNVSLREVDPHD